MEAFTFIGPLSHFPLVCLISLRPSGLISIADNSHAGSAEGPCAGRFKLDLGF